MRDDAAAVQMDKEARHVEAEWLRFANEAFGDMLDHVSPQQLSFGRDCFFAGVARILHRTELIVDGTTPEETPAEIAFTNALAKELAEFGSDYMLRSLPTEGTKAN